MAQVSDPWYSLVNKTVILVFSDKKRNEITHWNFLSVIPK